FSPDADATVRSAGGSDPPAGMRYVAVQTHATNVGADPAAPSTIPRVDLVGEQGTYQPTAVSGDLSSQPEVAGGAVIDAASYYLVPSPDSGFVAQFANVTFQNMPNGTAYFGVS